MSIRSYDFFFFFFSSRRRHTRFDCDWSSDVCSSDLAVPARADHHPGGERAGVARDLDAARDLAHLAHARALVQPGARRGRAPEEEGVELGAHDAVARGAVPVRLVLLLAGRDRDGRERLDGVRVRRRVDLQVGERGVRDPTGARLDAREARGVQDGDARPRPRSRSRPSCPRTPSSRPRGGRRVEPRGRRRRAGGARPPPPRADPGAPRACPPSSALAASREAPFKMPRARAIVRRVSAAPVTLEGWYVLHSMYAVDWPRWNALGAAERDAIAAEATALLERQAAPADGHSGCWTLLGHKGDLCLMHWRRDLEALRVEEVALGRTRLRAFLVPTYSYLSVIELGTYELAGHAEARLRARGVAPEGAPLEEEMRQIAAPRLFPKIPPRRYLCFYPMSKRRG